MVSALGPLAGAQWFRVCVLQSYTQNHYKCNGLAIACCNIPDLNSNSRNHHKQMVSALGPLAGAQWFRVCVLQSYTQNHYKCDGFGLATCIRLHILRSLIFAHVQIPCETQCFQCVCYLYIQHHHTCHAFGARDIPGHISNQKTIMTNMVSRSLHKRRVLR